MCTIVICPNCGKETPEGKFCESCGASVQTTLTFQQPVAQQPVYTQQPSQGTNLAKKNPILALILSLIICGVGQMYNGQLLKGVIMLVATIIMAIATLWPISLIIVVYSMYDAYTTAQKINNGEVV